MKKLFLLFLASLQFHQNGMAQRDAKADEILKAVSAQYKTYKSLAASFKLSIENQKEKSATTQSGVITIKGNMYRIDLKDQEIISDGKSVWTFLKEEKEVQINDATSNTDEAISPSRIFTLYEKGFKTRYAGEEIENGIVLQQIELSPEDTKKPYYKIQLSINKSLKNVVRAKIFNKNAIHFSYVVNTFNPDAPAPDQIFSFDVSKHPGVEVVDLR